MFKRSNSAETVLPNTTHTIKLKLKLTFEKPTNTSKSPERFLRPEMTKTINLFCRTLLILFLPNHEKNKNDSKSNRFFVLRLVRPPVSRRPADPIRSPCLLVSDFCVKNRQDLCVKFALIIFVINTVAKTIDIS